MPPTCSATDRRPARWRPRRAPSAWMAALLLAGACAPHQAAVRRDPSVAATVEAISRQAMTTYKLKSMIVRVRLDGSDVFTGAFGESMTAVPATPAMRFRNGAFAYSYLGYITAQLAAADVFSLDDTIDRWLPELPRANQVRVGDLPRNTSGYSDYVYSDEVSNAVYREPFRQWSTDELIRIGVNGPQQFNPGANWGYSHTNFAVLARLLETSTDKTLHQLMDTYVFEPMQLSATGDNGDTPAIPEPVQHSFTSERRSTLQVPAAIPFYEDSTYWNPSWTAPAGAVQTSNIFDVATSIEMIGSGALVSPKAHALQVSKQLIGSKDPQCAACRTLSEEFSYGMGVELQKDWIVQTKEFVGSYVTGGYLPAKKLTIAVAVTVLPEAFDAEGNAEQPQVIRAVFRDFAVSLGGAATLPALPPG